MAMAVVVTALGGILGLICGWIGNIVIDRVPVGRGVLGPTPVCPRCGQTMGPHDTIVVRSRGRVRGRCRRCGQMFAARYPAVVAGMGVLFATTARLFATMAPPDYWALPGMFLFVWMLPVVALIDYRTRRIPNALTYPLTPVLLVLLVGAAVLNGTPGRAVEVLIGAVGAFVFLLVLALINPRGMGMGDVKYAAFLGMGLGYLGIGVVVVGIVGAFLFGSVISLGLIVGKLRNRKDTIPFGPFLSLGALVGVWLGPAIIAAYLQSMTPR